MEGVPWAVDGRRLLALGRNTVAFFSLTQANQGVVTVKLCVECKFRTRHTDLDAQGWLVGACGRTEELTTDHSFWRFACARPSWFC